MSDLILKNQKIWKIFSFVFLFQLSFLTLIGMAVFHILYLVILILFILIFISNFEYEWTIVDTIVSVYFGARIISILLSEYPSLSQITWTREIIFYPYYYIASFYLQNVNLKGSETIFNWIIIGGVATAIVSIFVYANSISARAETISAGYSSVATHLSFVVGILFVKIFKIEKKRFIYFLISLILITAIILTFTRSAWIVAGAIFIFSMYRINKILLFASIALFTISAFAITPIRERMITFLNPEQNDSGRILLWQNATTAIKQKIIFGWGPETFNGINQDKNIYADPKVETWHNEFLQNGVEGGLILFFSYCAIYAIALNIFFNKLSNDGISAETLLIAFLIIAFISAAFFSNLMRDILNGYFVKFILALFSTLYVKKIKI